MVTRQRTGITLPLVVLLGNAVLLGALAALGAATAGTTFWAVGALGTLLIAALAFFLGRGTAEVGAPAPPRAQPAPAPAARPAVERAQPAQPAVSAEQGAVQMLAILQREGRLVDFLQEEIGMYEDAQIGAAVRAIHEGCRKALAEHAQVEPIFAQAEGSSVTVTAGFDTRSVRLSGDVSGEPPFRGALRHRGWRVARVDLPRQTPSRDQTLVVAPAEVEVGA